jgi:hypothetical protein
MSLADAAIATFYFECEVHGFPFDVMFGHLLQVASLEIFYENSLISS